MQIVKIIAVIVLLGVVLYFVYTKMIKKKSNFVEPHVIQEVKKISYTAGTIEQPTVITAQKGLGLIVN